MIMKRIGAWVSAALVVALLTGMPGNIALAQEGARTPEQICAEATENIVEPETREYEQAEDVLEEDVDYWAVLCTAQGPITIDLFEEVAPLAVNSFVFLAREGYFNNTTFHRVLPGFMAQGGDPTGTGTGGPGYQFADETDNDLVFDRPGLLAMANAGPNTNGSQFFITYTQTPWLNGLHTIFGQVYSGQAFTELLTPRNPEQMPAYEGDALQTVVILEGAESIDAVADTAPTLDEWGTILQRLIADLIGPPFTQDEAQSGTQTLEERIAYWGEVGGDTLAEYMSEYLATNDFMGAAMITMVIAECPADPAELPFWGLRFEVSDYGNEENATAVGGDAERAAQLVESGVFETETVATMINGRILRAPVDEHECGDQGVWHRLEVPYGRYLLAVEALLDESVISDEGEVSPEQFLVYLMDSIMIGSIGGPLERGNLAE